MVLFLRKRNANIPETDASYLARLEGAVTITEGGRKSKSI